MALTSVVKDIHSNMTIIRQMVFVVQCKDKCIFLEEIAFPRIMPHICLTVFATDLIISRLYQGQIKFVANSIYHVLDDSENTISYNRAAKQSVCMRKILPLHYPTPPPPIPTAGSHICHIPTAKPNLNTKIPLNFKNKKNGLQL